MKNHRITLGWIFFELRKYYASIHARSLREKWTALLFHVNLWALLDFRIGQFLYQRPYLYLFRLPYSVLHLFISISSGIQIPLETQIDKGLILTHFGGIVIHPRSRIGKNARISQGVTVGRVRPSINEAPVIGDNTTLYSHSSVLGPVSLGSNVVVGAHALVIRSFDNNVILGGNPAKQIGVTSEDFTDLNLIQPS